MGLSEKNGQPAYQQQSAKYPAPPVYPQHALADNVKSVVWSPEAGVCFP